MTRPFAIYRLIGYLSQPLKLVYRIEARGLENLPHDRGFVLAANHTSNFDPWVLGLPLFPQRFLRFMAKSELFWWPLGPIVHGAGAFKVRRGTGDVEAIETAVELVRGGDVVVMFPEGTRQRKGLVKKHAARPHTGAARIAHDADAPLVPAAVKGTDRLARLAKLRVAYGQPLQASEDLHETTERLMTEIERLHEAL
jgi:1-acyl-sn-glycerol-3-phosphate acyltransferase